MSEILHTHTHPTHTHRLACRSSVADLGEFSKKKKKTFSGAMRLAVHNNKHEAGSSSRFRIAHRGTPRVRESPGALNVYVYGMVCYGMGRGGEKLTNGRDSR